MLERYHELFMADIKRRIFDENWVRVNKCLDLISEDELWHTENENVNSVGNLLLHLRGNITQYICAGILQELDIRDRAREFDTPVGAFGKEELRSMFAETMTMIRTKIALLTPEMLIRKYKVQGFEENGIAILIHVTEHLSYHVGQITHMVKSMRNIDTAYYGGLDLNAKSK